MTGPKPIPGAPITTRIREAVIEFRRTPTESPKLIYMNAITLGALAAEWGIIDGIEEAGNLILGLRIDVRPTLASGVIQVR